MEDIERMINSSGAERKEEVIAVKKRSMKAKVLEEDPVQSGAETVGEELGESALDENDAVTEGSSDDDRYSDEPLCMDSHADVHVEEEGESMSSEDSEEDMVFSRRPRLVESQKQSHSSQRSSSRLLAFHCPSSDAAHEAAIFGPRRRRRDEDEDGSPSALRRSKRRKTTSTSYNKKKKRYVEVVRGNQVIRSPAYRLRSREKHICDP